MGGGVDGRGEWMGGCVRKHDDWYYDDAAGKISYYSKLC